jgi:hypothetical protein
MDEVEGSNPSCSTIFYEEANLHSKHPLTGPSDNGCYNNPMNSNRSRRGRPVRSGTNSTPAEKTVERLGAATRSVAARITIGVGSLIVLILIIIALSVWFRKVYADPKHVFWGTLANSLSTSGVTKEVTEKNNSTTSCRELTQLLMGSQPVIRDIKKYTTQAANGPTRVTVETLSTSSGDYTHYLSIERPAAKNGKKLDYSSVYGLWIKNSGSGRCNGSPIFGNAVFGAVLFGDLRPGDRPKVVELLHSSYDVNFATVNRGNDQDGRRVYTYDVSLKLRNYSAAARQYAESIGLPNAQQINPNNYSKNSKLKVKITIDVLAHQVRRVSYKSTNVAESYSGYGIRNDAPLPARTVSLQQLQNSLNAIK